MTRMNTQIYDEAGEWIVRHRTTGLDAAARRRFDAWLRASPENVRAYLEMSSVWEELGSLDPARTPPAAELLAAARAPDNVVMLGTTDDARESAGAPLEDVHPSKDRPGRRGLGWSLAASVLLVLAGAWLYAGLGTYATGVGEQRSIVLEDGSTIELNSRSRVRVRYGAAERRVELLEGQALFAVAPNKARPFVVHSGGIRVRAVGTQFDVYRKAAGTVVTVVEGKVAVIRQEATKAGDASPPAPGRTAAPAPAPLVAEVLLAAGEQVVVAPAAAAKPRRADVAAATAWTRRSLVFEASRLAEVAQEFNRYNARQLVVADPALADLRVSGVFSSVDPELLLRFLRSQPELVVEETGREIRISHR